MGGNPVKVAAIPIGSGGDYAAKMALAVECLNVVGREGVDIACLPEAFCGLEPEPVPGRTTDAIGAIARQYSMYIICPMVEKTPEANYNTVVLIDRRGAIVGKYRKMFVFWGENLTPSRDGVPVFETDFGSICLLTCFDINFPELWQEADDKDAEIVFWPSAYAGGMPLNAYAMLYHYYVVPVGAGNILDITGEPVGNVLQPHERAFVATLDLDRTLVHDNFTGEKVARLLAEHGDSVVLERRFDWESWSLLASVRSGVRVRELCREYKIETLREYLHRSREQINAIRTFGGTV